MFPPVRPGSYPNLVLSTPNTEENDYRSGSEKKYFKHSPEDKVEEQSELGTSKESSPKTNSREKENEKLHEENGENRILDIVMIFYRKQLLY